MPHYICKIIFYIIFLLFNAVDKEFAAAERNKFSGHTDYALQEENIVVVFDDNYITARRITEGITAAPAEGKAVGTHRRFHTGAGDHTRYQQELENHHRQDHRYTQPQKKPAVEPGQKKVADDLPDFFKN